MSKPPILIIVGPTASGKSDLAVRLAKKLDGEVVSADSRQVYTGLDIGSGKITRREMQGVPHHLLDVASPKRTFTVSQYQRLAYKAIDGILKRGKLPIVVGGTGLYIQAIVDGIVIPEVAPNAKLRAKLERMLAKSGDTSKLFAMLKKLDPARAKTIDRHNPRRLVRAIEIAEALGKVPKLIAKPRYSPVIIGLRPTIHDLRFKIHERLVKRMKQGMVAEVKRLHTQGVSWQRMFNLGLEYRYTSLFVQGKLSKQEMLDKIQIESEHYSKRQMTWFKRDARITWLPGSQANPNPSLVPRIRSLLRRDAREAL